MRSSPKTPHPVHLGLSILILLLATVTSWAANEDIGSIQYNSTIGAYEIKTVKNLQDLSYYVRGILTSGVPANNAKGKTFKMTTDINTTFSSSCASILPIGTSTYPFKGVFDGQGHTLGHICIDRSSENNVGLFGYIYEGTVKNLKLYGAKVNGKDTVGGIVAYNYGNVSNCSLDSSIVTGKNRVGGITGYSGITLKNNTVNNLVRITGTDEVGCIVGRGNNVVQDNFCNGALFYNTNETKAGAISKVTTGQFQNNYYYNVRVGSTKKNSGFGTYSGDASANNAAMPVAKITSSNNSNSIYLSINTNASYTDKDNTPYWLPGTTIDLKSSQNMNDGQRASFTVKKTGTNTTVPVSYDTTRYTVNGHFTMPAEDVTIILGDPIKVYGKITYHNLGDADNSINPSQYQMYQSNLVLKNPTRDGYTFLGWWNNSTFSGYSITSISFSELSKSTVDIYAKWAAYTYTVKFNSNGGDGSMSNQVFTYDEAPKALSANEFTAPAGCSGFIGWNTEADGSGTAYQDAQEVRNLSSENNGVVELYAQWKKDIATNGNISVSKIPDQEWTGNPITPTITIMDGETDITKEMEISYSDNINIGEASATITPKSTSSFYSGSTTATFNIVKATPHITAPIGRKLTYNGTVQYLIASGYTYDGTTLLYSLDGKNYSTSLPKATNAGKYTVYYKVEETDHYREIEGSVDAIIQGTYTKYAFIDINEIDEKTYATIDGNYTDTDAFKITQDIPVDEVQFNRVFTPNVYSTIVLPFDVSSANLSGVDSILAFGGMTKKDGKKAVQLDLIWTDDGHGDATLKANTPYIIRMNKDNLGINTAVTFKETTDPIVTIGKWSFIGTYALTKWNEDHEDYGHIYGYSGQSKDDISVGQFVKFMGKSYFNPLRAYLRYNGESTSNAPIAKGEADATASIDDELPDRIDVVIVDRRGEEEHTTVIGTLDTRTGEIRFKNNSSRTFDLKGRGISGKPRAKGVYLKK